MSIPALLASVTRRLSDLETFQLPRLDQCLGPLDLHRELADEFRGDLEDVRYTFEVIKEVYESASVSEKQSYLAQIQELQQRYTSLRSSFRTASLRSKKVITSRRSRVHELAQKSSRYELDERRLGGADEGALAAGSTSTSTNGRGEAKSAAELGMGGDDELQTKTNEVTTALRRTTALMQTELERSVLSVQMLESSTQTLLSTSNLYDTYTSLLQASGQLVKALEKADTFDRLIILAALFFFLLVVGFIVKRRVLDRTVGVVLGGVGKGLAWYVFGTGRLVRLALGGGKAQAASVASTGTAAAAAAASVTAVTSALSAVSVGTITSASSAGVSAGDTKTTTTAIASISPDSAVGGVPPNPSSEPAPDLDLDQLRDEHHLNSKHAAVDGQIVGIDIGPGHIPYNPAKGAPKADPGAKGKGRIEAIPNPPHIEERLSRERERERQRADRSKDEL